VATGEIHDDVERRIEKAKLVDPGFMAVEDEKARHRESDQISAYSDLRSPTRLRSRVFGSKWSAKIQEGKNEKQARGFAFQI
jgi:hypothetical protein